MGYESQHQRKCTPKEFHFQKPHSTASSFFLLSPLSGALSHTPVNCSPSNCPSITRVRPKYHASATIVSTRYPLPPLLGEGMYTQNRRCTQNRHHLLRVEITLYEVSDMCRYRRHQMQCSVHFSNFIYEFLYLTEIISVVDCVGFRCRGSFWYTSQEPLSLPLSLCSLFVSICFCFKAMAAPMLPSPPPSPHTSSSPPPCSLTILRPPHCTTRVHFLLTFLNLA